MQNTQLRYHRDTSRKIKMEVFTFSTMQNRVGTGESRMFKTILTLKIENALDGNFSSSPVPIGYLVKINYVVATTCGTFVCPASVYCIVQFR